MFSEIYNPAFERVADMVFDANGTRTSPYFEEPGFLSAPPHMWDARDPDFGDLQVALVGVPMDLGVTNPSGARFGRLDPAFAPGTGTPEVGGLTPREVSAMLRGLKGIDIVGADVDVVQRDCL